MKQKLCLASTNPRKLIELRRLLGDIFELCSLQDFESILEPEEPYETFKENAQAKASYYAKKLDILTLSEDSGLVIESLGGFPGVHSKRFIEECGGIEQAFHALEERLRNQENKKATFVCCSGIFDPKEGRYYSGFGKMEGRLTFPSRGNRGSVYVPTYGFGYDPIFIPDGYDQTIAELGEEVKSEIGHRGHSIRNLLENLPKNWK